MLPPKRAPKSVEHRPTSPIQPLARFIKQLTSTRWIQENCRGSRHEELVHATAAGHVWEGRKKSVGWTVESKEMEKDEVLQAKHWGALCTNVVAIGKDGP